jgi:hypothetical protein
MGKQFALRTPWRWAASLTAAALLAALAGCSSTAAAMPATASSVPSPTSRPAVSYDVVVTRTFTAGSTIATCTVSDKVVPDPQPAGKDADQRIVAARKVLVSRDWQADPVALAEVSADDQKVNHDHGESDAAMLAGVLLDHMGAALNTAGLMGNGVATQGRVSC